MHNTFELVGVTSATNIIKVSVFTTKLCVFSSKKIIWSLNPCPILHDFLPLTQCVINHKTYLNVNHQHQWKVYSLCVYSKGTILHFSSVKWWFHCPVYTECAQIKAEHTNMPPCVQRSVWLLTCDSSGGFLALSSRVYRQYMQGCKCTYIYIWTYIQTL